MINQFLTKICNAVYLCNTSIHTMTIIHFGFGSSGNPNFPFSIDLAERSYNSVKHYRATS